MKTSMLRSSYSKVRLSNKYLEQHNKYFKAFIDTKLGWQHYLGEENRKC